MVQSISDKRISLVLQEANSNQLGLDFDCVANGIKNG